MVARACLTTVLAFALVMSSGSSGAAPGGRLTVAVRNPLQLAVGGGSLWVTTPRRLIRIDPVSGRVLARIGLPALAGAIAVAGHQVWVATNPIITSPTVARRGSLFSIDDRTNKVVGKPIRLLHPTGIAVAAGRLWISNGQHGKFGRVTYINPQTRRVLGSIATPGAPESIVAAGDSIWVGASDSGQVVRINPYTAKVVGRPIKTGGALLQLATAKSALWVADDYHGRLLAIDPGSGQISQRRPTPGILTIAATRTTLWALFNRQQEIVSLNSHTGLPFSPPIRFEQRPLNLFATSSAVWVTTPSHVVRLSQVAPARLSISQVTLRHFILQPSGLLFSFHPTDARILVTASANQLLKVCEDGTTFSSHWQGGCRTLTRLPLQLPTSGGAVHVGFRVMPIRAAATSVMILRIRWHCVDHDFIIMRGATHLARAAPTFDC
jgi:hypothetical protein